MEQNNAASVFSEEIIYSGAAEQGVEMDYVLPDYYPDVFKVLSCELSPRILSYSQSADGRLEFEAAADIRAVYLAEQAEDIFCVSGSYTFSKSVQFAKYADEVIFDFSKDYCTCRAVSPRRIDIRGAVSCRIKAMGVEEIRLPALGEGLQVKKESFSSLCRPVSAKKILNIREDIDAGAEGIAFILGQNAAARISDVRIVADKAVIKGAVAVSALYGLKKSDSAGADITEKMSAEIPVSAILELPEISDSHAVFPRLSVLSCALQTNADRGIISCELTAECFIKAFCEEKLSVPLDVYSTKFETEFITKPVKISLLPKEIKLRTPIKCELAADCEIGAVWDAACALKNFAGRRADSGKLSVSGQLCASAWGKNSENVPFYIEKTEPFEQELDEEFRENGEVSLEAQITSADYAIKPDGIIEITAQCAVNGTMREINETEIVSEVKVYEDKPKRSNDEFALRIFYSENELSCYEIAKMYNTSPEAVALENISENAESDMLSGMIVIPSV